MLHPGLAYLLKAIVVSRSAAHSIEIVRNDRMSCRRQRKKIHDHVSGIARGRAYTQADLGPVAAKLGQASYLTDVSGDNIGARVKTLRRALDGSGRGISRAEAQTHEQRERETPP
jgi:hypothetical protein